LFPLALQPQPLLLGQRAVLVAEPGLGLLEPLDRSAQGDEVGQRAAQPAIGDVELAAAAGLLGDRLLRLALGADEQDALSLGAEPLHELRDLIEHLQGLLQIDDVDPIALAEDVGLHLRIPAPGLVPEVDASFQQFFHRDFYQGSLPSGPGLPLAELEPGAGALLTVLLALLLARIARQQAGRLQSVAQLGVVLEQGARDAVPDRAGLARAATPDHRDEDVESLGSLRQQQGCFMTIFSTSFGKY